MQIPTIDVSLLSCTGIISHDCRLIRCDQGRVLTIDDLPEDVLLAIFDFYVVPYQDVDFLEVMFHDQDSERKIQSWQSLVHVCRRWRGLVFASPRRLNLQLYCDPGRSVRKTMDVWPAMPLPLLIQGNVDETTVDNVIAELEHSHRIRQITLICHTFPQIEKLWTALQVPFPELAGLYLGGSSYMPVLPDSILGGSAPRLRYSASGITETTFIPHSPCRPFTLIPGTSHPRRWPLAFPR
jgi:hypothetical protein